MDSFSNRHGYSRPDAEITILHDAPEQVRAAVIQISYECALKPSVLRSLLCALLFKTPDRGNWSEFPNIDSEVHELMDECEWFEVYDLIEIIARESEARFHGFCAKMNNFFRVKGVGWQLVEGRLEVRGTEAFESAVRQGQTELKLQGRLTAATELHEALVDLSRRPNAETTGAIQHAMAALECVARDVAGSKETLGTIIQRNDWLFPAPVNHIVEKAWGYTSNFGRHLIEGRGPKFEEAELVVGLSGVLCRYLARTSARK